MGKYAIGDWVEVKDPGLLSLYEVMRKYDPNAKPNNLGRIAEIWADDEYLIEFPIGDDPMDEHSQVAPYHVSDLVPHDPQR